MTPNILTFILRGNEQLRKYGFRLLWHRYFQRQRILKTKPVPCPDSASIEIHTLVCQRDWLNAIWTLKSFRVFSAIPFRLVVHSDPAMPAHLLEQLAFHFPGAVIARRETVGPQLTDLRKQVPLLVELWETGRYSGLARIVDAFVLCQQKTYFTIDPDVLFFEYPRELLERNERSNTLFGVFNVERHKKTTDGTYCIDEAILFEKFAIRLPVDFNFGLGWINRAMWDWPFLNDVLTQVPLNREYPFVLDQTIAAIMGIHAGFSPLPAERYAVEPVESLDGVVARHYYSNTRDLFYVEGIASLMKHNFPDAINRL